jgi:hypothetical protein
MMSQLIVLLIAASSLLRPIQANVLKQESYPSPAQESELPTVEATPPATTQPYPSAAPNLTTPAPIGIQMPPESLGGEPAAPVETPDSRGLLFMWVGFTATLLIFLTSVVGSIVLFTRRNET